MGLIALQQMQMTERHDKCMELLEVLKQNAKSRTAGYICSSSMLEELRNGPYNNTYNTCSNAETLTM